jgi:hypothetical protein
MSLAPPGSFTFAALALDPIPFVRGLSQLFSEQRLRAILSRTDRASERRRRLPAESVIWLVVAMALFAADSIPKVWRRLHPTRDQPEPTDAAFTQARRRLGVAPLRQLFLETARPMATHQTIGAFYTARGPSLRVVSALPAFYTDRCFQASGHRHRSPIRSP